MPAGLKPKIVKLQEFKGHLPLSASHNIDKLEDPLPDQVPLLDTSIASVSSEWLAAAAASASATAPTLAKNLNTVSTTGPIAAQSAAHAPAIQTLGTLTGSRPAPRALAACRHPTAETVFAHDISGSPPPKKLPESAYNIELGVFRSWDDASAFANLSLPLDSTVYSLANLFCNDVISKFRGDFRVSAHLWKLRIGQQIPNGKRKWATRVFESCDESWMHARSHHGPSNVVAENEECSTNLADLNIHPATIFEFQYDYGSTVILYAKVLGIGRPTPQTLLRPSQQEHEIRSEIEREKKMIAALPASSVADHLRLDSLFPSFSRLFMHPSNICCTLGLSDACAGDDDVHFCLIERASGCSIHGVDILSSVQAFPDMDEFLALAERAFMAGCASRRIRDNDDCGDEEMEEEEEADDDEEEEGQEEEEKNEQSSNGNDHDASGRNVARFDGVCRILIPCVVSEDTEQNLKKLEKCFAKEWWSSKQMIRFSPLELEKAKRSLSAASFSFASMFPLTHKNFTCGKFRWILFSQGQLRVCCGRSVGKYGRECKDDQVLFSWSKQHSFQTLHHLMCAIEASWPPLAADGTISHQPEVDTDIGPKRPRPPRATAYASAARTFAPRIIKTLEIGKVPGLPCVKASASSVVNCLAFGRQSSAGHRWLYSGHRDGTITKWDCQSMTSVWTTRAYGKGSDGTDTSCNGVTQLIVNSPGTQIFCFTNSNLMISFSASNGQFSSRCEVDCGPKHEYSDDDSDDDSEEDSEDDDDESGSAKPRISCAVLDESVAKVPIMFVGLSCYANRHPRYTNERGHGNIKIIHCETGRHGLMFQQRTQFVGHRQPVHALALIPGRALVSVDYCLRPQYIIVWNIARNEDLDNRNIFQNKQISIGGGQILKRLRINNLSYRRFLERQALDNGLHFFGSKFRKFIQEHAPYHRISSIEGISTVRLPLHKKCYWMTNRVKAAADVIVLYCNLGRLLCYITLNLGGDSPMKILGYSKVCLNSGFEDQIDPGCFRTAAPSASVLLPSSQYVNFSAAVDVLDTASDLLHQAFNQTRGPKLLAALNSRLCSELQPTDEFTDMEWETPEMPSDSEDDTSSGSYDSHDDAVSLKFKAERNRSSDDDSNDADDRHQIDQKRLFQVCFPDLDDVSPQASGGHDHNLHASYSSYDDGASATAPRVFAFDEHKCVAGYGDGSIRLQQLQPNFSHKSSILAARCASTVFPFHIFFARPTAHARVQCSYPPECSSEPVELEHSYFLNDAGERFDRECVIM